MDPILGFLWPDVKWLLACYRYLGPHLHYECAYSNVWLRPNLGVIRSYAGEQAVCCAMKVRGPPLLRPPGSQHFNPRDLKVWLMNDGVEGRNITVLRKPVLRCPPPCAHSHPIRRAICTPYHTAAAQLATVVAVNRAPRAHFIQLPIFNSPSKVSLTALQQETKPGSCGGFSAPALPVI